MTQKELCEMCTEYSIADKCENKKTCKLQAILIENKSLKAEVEQLKRNLAKLQSDLAWSRDDNQMGRW